jgi:ribosomal silencing factor RsfS
MGIQINKPRDERAFLDSMVVLANIKKKAVSMLFEEIEQEVHEKERFVTLQIDKLQEMTDSFQTMLDY